MQGLAGGLGTFAELALLGQLHGLAAISVAVQFDLFALVQRGTIGRHRQRGIGIFQLAHGQQGLPGIVFGGIRACRLRGC